jgi:S1-C subfamily serine protease
MIDRRALREGIIASYNLEELRTVCYDLGIEYEDLSGENKSTRVIALIEYVWRRGKLDALLDYCRQDRPLYAWPALEPAAASPPVAAMPAEATRAWQTEFGIRALRAAVVSISAFKQGQSNAIGHQCGFLVDPRGYVLTMDWELGGLTRHDLVAQWNRLNLPAKFVGRNPSAHVALLKIEVGDQLYNAQFSAPAGDAGDGPRVDALFPAAALSTEQPAVADEVYLLGHSPESGWINSPGRIVQLDATQDEGEVPLTLVEIESRRGFSGAPYMNWRGHVVGVHLGRQPNGPRMMIPARYGLELIAANL